MFWRKQADRDQRVTAGPEMRQVLRCSFCNKLQDEVPKLIAGPKVFICDECVAVCNDILAEDEKWQQRTGNKDRERKAERARRWPTAILCGLCRAPIPAGEGVTLAENRGTLCAECVNAVRAAASDDSRPRADQ